MPEQNVEVHYNIRREACFSTGDGQPLAADHIQPGWSDNSQAVGEENATMEPRNYWRGEFCVEVSSAPGSLIIFGASGDLAKRKLFPALYSLHQRRLLHESSRIIGIGRTEYSSESFREWLRPAFAGEPAPFLEHVEYLAGDYGSAELYQSLNRVLDEYEQHSGFPSQRTYYLALPTTLYQTVIENLSGAGMLSGPDQDQTWRHLVLEKPFGRDFASARELDLWLHKYL
ncbi:MAG: hypothetical protein GX564_00680, partial [Oligosphaeraceae bacterium]|nr:hypothetical protein [Oligosphaeraceae bacterium]